MGRGTGNTGLAVEDILYGRLKTSTTKVQDGEYLLESGYRLKVSANPSQPGKYHWQILGRRGHNVASSYHSFTEEAMAEKNLTDALQVIRSETDSDSKNQTRFEFYSDPSSSDSNSNYIWRLVSPIGMIFLESDSCFREVTIAKSAAREIRQMLIDG